MTPLIESDKGNVYDVELKSAKQMGIFRKGDEVIFSRALAAPVLVNRIPKKYVCPSCGVVFALDGENACHTCSFPIVKP